MPRHGPADGLYERPLAPDGTRLGGGFARSRGSALLRGRATASRSVTQWPRPRRNSRYTWSPGAAVLGRSPSLRCTSTSTDATLLLAGEPEAVLARASGGPASVTPRVWRGRAGRSWNARIGRRSLSTHDQSSAGPGLVPTRRSRLRCAAWDDQRLSTLCGMGNRRGTTATSLSSPVFRGSGALVVRAGPCHLGCFGVFRALLGLCRSVLLWQLRR